jgi:hypothetical protein
MEVTFEQNIDQYDVIFNQENNEITVDILNETVIYESVFSELGEKGESGKSAYQIAVDNGFLGTEQQWIASLSVSQTHIKNEIPNGVINNSNTIFISQNNFIPESVEVFLNGLIQQKIIEFQTIGNNNITLTTSPTIGEIVLINYIKL